MSEIVNQSLQKIAKGTGIIFIGTIIGMLLGFVSRVIIVRYTTQSEYGIYSLALVILNIFATISTLGLQEGTTRYIAYFRGKKEGGKVKGVISSSLKIALIASISLAAISFFSSDFISVSIFHTPALSTPLKIFAIAIPFTVLINVFIAIFRGFDRVDARVYFQNILGPVLYLLFLIAVVLFGLSFIGVVYAYVLSIAATCVLFVIYLMKKLPLSIRSGSSTTNPMTWDLLFFSIPLLAVSMLMMTFLWTDTLMLGYFKTPDAVGLYNAALPLASFLSLVLNSLGFLYTPLVTQFYSKNQMEELRRTYAISTKWCFLCALPIFFILFLFPDVVLNLLFGSRYISAAVALQILALGFFLNPLLGPIYNTLIAIGKTKIIMQTYLICGFANVALNIILIPSLGIVGAAIASASTYVIGAIVFSLALYQYSRAHPLTRNYLKSVIIAIGVIFIIYIIAKNFLMVTFWMLLVLFMIFLVMYALLLLLTKSFDDEDIVLILEIEKRLGINLTIIKRFLRRFV